MDIATGLKKVRQGVASISLATMLVSMLLTGVAQAAVANYNDVPAGAWYYTPVMTLANAAVVDGPSATNNYNYNPNGSVNRAMMTKFAVLAAKFTLVNPATPSFKDEDKAAWYYPYVETAAAHAIVSGYKDVSGNLTGKFGPGDYVTRGQGAKILDGAFSLAAYTPANATFPDVNPTMWEYPYVETAAHWSVIKGNPDGTFKAANNMNRAELAQMVVGAMNPVVANNVPNVPPVSGALNASLASDSPTATTLPANATAVSLMKFNLVSTASDVVVNSVTVHKSGVGTLPTDFQGYLYNGTNRLTAGKSLNSSTEDMTFTNLNLAIAKGNTASLTVKADMGTIAASDTVQFQISAVASNAASVAGLPLTSAQFGLSTTTVGTVTIDKNGTITSPKVGEKGVTIAKFKITAATEAAKIQQFGLYLAGTISTGDIVNLNLYASDTAAPLATVAAVNTKDIASFVLATPYSIEKGGTRNFTVTADLNTGRNGDTLKAYIDEKTDVVAIGDKYGFGMKVDTMSTDSPAGTYDGTSCTSTAGSCTYSALEGGDITVSSSGPVSADIAVNAKNVHLLDFNITSVSNVTFKNFGVGLIASENTVASGLLSTSTANFTNIQIVDAKTGKVYMGPVDSTSFITPSDEVITESTDAAQAYYLYTDELTMAAGQSLDLSLTADVANNSSLSSDTLIASLELGTTYPQIRDVNNKTLTNSTSLVPSSIITAKTMTVVSAGLTMSLSATPVTKTYVKGTKGVKFAGLTFACGTASKCTITDITLQGYIDDSGSAGFSATGTGTAHSTQLNSIVGSVSLTDAAGNIIAAAKGVQADGTVVFSNLSWNLNAGDTVTAYVTGDISSNAFVNTDAEKISFGISSIANVSAEDASGNTISSITGTPNGSTSPSTYVTTSGGGTLAITVDASTPKESIVIAGTAGQQISKFKFTSTAEAFVVKKLSINNRQSAVAASNLGDYDNNVTQVKISYINEAGATETKTGTLTSGTAQFNGLDMLVPADNDATLTVSADLNTITGGATAGEFVDLNIGLDSFSAVAQGSGVTYTGAKFDGATPTLSIGTTTFVPAVQTSFATAQTVTLNTSKTVTVTDQNMSLPVGTLIKFGLNSATYLQATEEVIALTTKYTDGDLTMTGLVVNDGNGSIPGTDSTAAYVAYALPGTGYLTTAKQQAVYESIPTLTLAAGSPSGSMSTNVNDTIFKFDVSANAMEKVSVKAAVNYNGESDLDLEVAGGDGEAVVSSTHYVSSASSERINLNATSDGDCWYKDTGTSLANYTRISGWYYVVDASSNDTFDGSKMYFAVDTTAPLGAPVAKMALAAGTLTEGAWIYVDGALDAIPAATETAVGFCFIGGAPGGSDATDYIYVDEINVYNNKVRVELSSDASMAAGGHTLPAYLKGGISNVTGYINETSTSAAAVDFFPTTDLDTSKGTTTNYYVETDTTTLITNQAGTDDILTPSINYGSETNGLVTAGDFWWSETNAPYTTDGTWDLTKAFVSGNSIASIQWLGYQSSNALSGNTLKY